MYISKLFLPLIRENPKEAQVISHRLMLRSGMIRQLSSGIYNWLPLGLMVLKNVENIIIEEMNNAGAQQILMPTIQPASLWEESGRYDAYGQEMLRITDRHENKMLYGPTNEEVVTDIFRNNVNSYKSLPINLYQIQWKFRDEIRPRFGIMRGREFLMKDAYSFDLTAEDAKKSYELMFETYIKIFKRIGVRAIPVSADTGPIGGNLSHEFHILASTGESAIYYDKAIETEENLNADHKYYAAADEQHDAANCPINPENLISGRGIEVGHIFYLGTKYSEAMSASVVNKEGIKITPEMGCYGIGVSRVVAAVIEASHDDKGIIWPESIAPFTYSVVPLQNNSEVISAAEKLYTKLKAEGKKVLYDDSSASPGAKMATHDLIGVPYQYIIGAKNLENGLIEFKNRAKNTSEMIEINKTLSHF